MRRYFKLLGFWGALAAILVILICPVSAQTTGTDEAVPEPGDRHQLRWERLAERLELDNEQLEAMAGIREKGRQQQVDLRKELLQLQNALEGEMLKDEPSSAKVNDLAAQMGAIKTQLQQIRLEQQLAIRQQLTPEQRDQLLLMRDGRKHFGRGKRGGRGGWGDKGCRFESRRGRGGKRGARSERMGRFEGQGSCQGWGSERCIGDGVARIWQGHASWYEDCDSPRPVQDQVEKTY